MGVGYVHLNNKHKSLSFQKSQKHYVICQGNSISYSHKYLIISCLIEIMPKFEIIKNVAIIGEIENLTYICQV